MAKSSAERSIMHKNLTGNTGVTGAIGPPTLPKPPLNTIMREGDTGKHVCPICESSLKRSYLKSFLKTGKIGKIIGCIQPGCENYYLRKEDN